MSKLKFDRLINLSMSKGEAITIPKDEIWKGRFYGVNDYAVLYVNGQKVLESDQELNCIEGATLRLSESNVTIQGIAFKVVENV